MTTPERLQAIREREQKATKGRCHAQPGFCDGELCCQEHNMLIEDSWEDIPFLLSLLQETQDEAERYRKALEAASEFVTDPDQTTYCEPAVIRPPEWAMQQAIERLGRQRIAYRLVREALSPKKP
jgi:hypothetical protein